MHKNCAFLIGTITFQNYAILWYFLHIDSHENITLPACLIVFVKSKTGNQLIRFVIAYLVLGSRQDLLRETVAATQDPRLRHSSQTYSLPTDLALILRITWYVEYCSSLFIGNVLKLNADELNRNMTDLWFGMQQSVIDPAIGQWQVSGCTDSLGLA